MPMIRVDWLEGRTPQQKAQLSDTLTKAFVDIAHVPKDQVWIVFNDVKRSDWAMGGTFVGDRPD